MGGKHSKQEIGKSALEEIKEEAKEQRKTEQAKSVTLPSLKKDSNKKSGSLVRSSPKKEVSSSFE